MTLEDVRKQFVDPTPAELQLIARYGAFTPDGRRERALSAFAKTGLPHRRLEQWKWSDVRQALPTIETPPTSTFRRLAAPDGACPFRFDGAGWNVPELLPKGIRVFEKNDAQALGNAEALPLAALAAALTGQSGKADILIVEISEDPQVPIYLDFDFGGREMAFARIAFLVRPGAHVDVIENHTGGAGLSSVIVEFGLQKEASATRTLLQSGSLHEVTGITSAVSLEERANFTQTALAFGAKLSRIETQVSYKGADAEANIAAAYLPAKGFHVDFTSHVWHGAESCRTRQVTKGAVQAGGRGVFQGKFHVPRTIGQHTDADMQHQALLLENGAEVFAKPELEIYADDVECAHGNTSGQLDESAIFYMRQRGIPDHRARAMLTEAFIADALELAYEPVREHLIDASRQFLRDEEPTS